MSAKFNVIIPDDLLERARKVADEKNISVAAIINEALRNTLEGDRISALESRVLELEKEIKKLKNRNK